MSKRKHSLYEKTHLSRIREIEKRFNLSIEDIFILYGEELHFNEVLKLINYSSYKLKDYEQYCKKRYDLSKPIFTGCTKEEEEEAFAELQITRESALRYRKLEYSLKRIDNKWALIKPPVYPTEYYLIKLEDKYRGRTNLINNLSEFLKAPHELYEVSYRLGIVHHEVTREVLIALGFKSVVNSMKGAYKKKNRIIKPKKIKSIESASKPKRNIIRNPGNDALCYIKEVSDKICLGLLAMFCLKK